MAKLSLETAQTIWDLQHQLLEIIDTSKTLELSLFESFGETERTIPYLDELQNIAEQGTDRFSRFSTLQLRVASTHPPLVVQRSPEKVTEYRGGIINREKGRKRGSIVLGKNRTR